MRSVLKFNSIITTTIILSFFCHLFVLSMINISFTQKFQTQPPYFISLGAIIPRNEFSIIKNSNNLGIKLIKSSYPQVNNLSKDTRLIKPNYFRTAENQNKSTSKTTFSTEKETDKKTISIPSIDTYLELYKPLELP